MLALDEADVGTVEDEGWLWLDVTPPLLLVLLVAAFVVVVAVDPVLVEALVVVVEVVLAKDVNERDEELDSD